MPDGLPRDVFILPAADDFGFRTSLYVISTGEETILIDVTDAGQLTPLSALLEREGLPDPGHVLLTHNHVSYQEAVIAEKWGAKMYLHPDDARSLPGRARYRDPMTDRHLAGLGFRFLPTPGHSPGHIMVLWQRHGGVLFTGDALIGISEQGDDGLRLRRPPEVTSRDDGALLRSLRALTPPSARHILPLHGRPLLGLTPGDFAAVWQRALA